MEKSGRDSGTPPLRHLETVLPYLRPIFVEEQRFGQRWVWVTVMCLSAGPVLTFGLMYLRSRTFAAWVPLLVVTIPIIIMVLFYATRLVVRVDVDGVHVRWWPFGNVDLPHHRIASVQAEDYDPMGEFGGWGIKGPAGRWGWCYTVSGRRGVRIELDNRHRLLIGSQRADELAEAIRSAGGRA